MSALWTDLRRVVRRNLRRPALPLTIVLILGLCLGANSTTLTLLGAFYERLPVPDSHRVVELFTADERRGA